MFLLFHSALLCVCVTLCVHAQVVVVWVVWVGGGGGAMVPVAFFKKALDYANNMCFSFVVDLADNCNL